MRFHREYGSGGEEAVKWAGGGQLTGFGIRTVVAPKTRSLDYDLGRSRASLAAKPRPSASELPKRLALRHRDSQTIG